MNRIIPLAELRPGMVLGDAASVDGQVLLSAGTTLNAAHLTVLSARGVRSLAVVIADEQRTPVDTKMVLTIDRSLRPRFARNDLQHPAMKELYRLALLRRIQRAVSHIQPTPGTGNAS